MGVEYKIPDTGCRKPVVILEGSSSGIEAPGLLGLRPYKVLHKCSLKGPHP
jgi:hypothetical protein